MAYYWYFLSLQKPISIIVSNARITVCAEPTSELQQGRGTKACDKQEYPEISVKIMRHLEIRIQYRSQPFIKRFYASVKPYVCLCLVTRNLSSVDFLTSKYKAKVNIKLSPKIRRLEIQDSCSSAGCGSIHKPS